ncbi:NADPH:quinone reductase-like Zn-dependent oxidoreductase [Propionibacteriaceae bacterium ES.041]|uniref:NADP-dependent oxidoreductase n=1 Tax=Enemella evansiae TaxID=2016499 RepID=UPI000B96FCA4|nr:NADP-dependent oxidoreductase [Enemella evansiae]OYN95037.1 alcohol dehydrogenase [Enemella evansiae]PFG66237.1 NADPH:quinone reductase-like Zn-dependent oxidoreductase [Propionibacteriaceae bacterium ES.041]
MYALSAVSGTTNPQLVELPDPTPGPGEIVVDVAATAINPADAQVVDGSLRAAFGLPDQVGLGWDVSGVVSAVGPEVDGFSVGDRVAGLHADLTAPARAQATRVALPATAVAPLPDGLDPVAAASIPLNTLTAAQALDLFGPADGRSLLVTGAAGAVGGYALALAAAAGWRVSGLARESDRDFVTGITGTDGTPVQLVTEVPERGFDAVLDAAGLQEGALPAVVDGGAFVGVFPPAPVPSERGITVQEVMVAPDGARLAELLRRSATGQLAVRVADSYPLTEAAAAYQRVGERGVRGRVLLIP